MEERFVDKYDEWNQPEWIQVDMTYMQKLEENLEYYKTTIKAIIEELESNDDNKQKLTYIKNYIDCLVREVK